LSKKQSWGKRKSDGQAYQRGPSGPVPISGGSYDIMSPPTVDIDFLYLGEVKRALPPTTHNVREIEQRKDPKYKDQYRGFQRDHIARAISQNDMNVTNTQRNTMIELATYEYWGYNYGYWAQDKLGRVWGTGGDKFGCVVVYPNGAYSYVGTEVAPKEAVLALQSRVNWDGSNAWDSPRGARF